MHSISHQLLKWTLLIWSAALVPVFATDNPNLLRNSGFDLGWEGYSVVRYLSFPDQSKYVVPELDATAPPRGKVSLKFPNPQDETIQFRSHEFRVVPGHPFNVSAWMRADVETTVVAEVLSVKMDENGKSEWKGGLKKFLVGPRWQRYDYAPVAAPGHDYYAMEFRWGNDGHKTTLSLNGLQVTQGEEVAAYQVVSEIECALTVPSHLYVEGDPKPSVTVKAINHSARSREIELSLTFGEGMSTASKPLTNLRFSLPPNGTVLTQTISLPVTQNGFFKIDGTWKEAGSNLTSNAVVLPLYYGVVGRYVSRPIQVDKDFCIAVESNMGHPRRGLSVPPFDGGFRGLEFGPEERFKLFQQEGIRLLRVGNSGPIFTWRELEPTPGKFEWKLSDTLVDLAARYQMQIMPVLGGIFVQPKPGLNIIKTMPDWLVEKSGVTEARGNWTGINREYQLVKISMDDWVAYVTAFVTRYKGRITHYEILNEPNLYLTPEEYAPYLKAAYETAKRIDPNCRIVGFCATGDFTGNSRGFVEDCIKLGLLRYTDIVSFHPYNARNDNTPTSAMEQIRGLRVLLDKAKPGVPLWNTELYFLYGYYGDGNKISPESPQADQLARRVLIDLGEGLGQSICLPSDKDLFNDLRPHWGYQDNGVYVFHKAIPSPIFIINNTLARFFEGASPVATLNWGKDAMGYIYRDREGKPIAAFWSRNEKAKVTVTFPGKGLSLQLFDLFGNPISPQDGAIPIGLERSPRYLKSAGDLAAFQKVLQSAAIESVENPVASKN